MSHKTDWCLVSCRIYWRDFQFLFRLQIFSTALYSFEASSTQYNTCYFSIWYARNAKTVWYILQCMKNKIKNKVLSENKKLLCGKCSWSRTQHSNKVTFPIPCARVCKKDVVRPQLQLASENKNGIGQGHCQAGESFDACYGGRNTYKPWLDGQSINSCLLTASLVKLRVFSTLE